MANGTFTPKPNAFLTTMQNLFQSPQQQFSDVVGKPPPKQMMPADFLTQLKGRFQNAEQMSQLKSTIGDYGKLAAGEQGYEQMPEATPEATPALSPVVQNATPAAPAQANAPAISPYSYQNMAQPDRDTRINELLGVLGADMARYEPGYVDPWDTSGEAGSRTRDKYQDILANFATDGGATKYGMNTNIYNRWGLPEDYYQNFVIPYLQQNAPAGQSINDIGAESGRIYDLNKAGLDIARKGRGPSDMERYVAPALNTILSAIAAWYIAPALAAPLSASFSGGAGAATTAAEAGLSQLPGAGVGLASEGGLASLAPALASSSGSMFSALPALSGAGEGLASEGFPVALSEASLGVKEATPATESTLKKILTNPITRKVAGEILNQIQSGGGRQEIPYYSQGTPYAEGAQQTPATDELTGGALTYKQMEQEPAADISATLATPFLSATQKREQKKNAAQILSKLRAAMREA